MATRPAIIAAFLRTAPVSTDDRTDDRLLAEFFAHRDEAAFAEIVRRHQRTVWSVCRRFLSNAADAEDAFQATFLILVRRGRTLADRGTVGGWLYRVAFRVSQKARTMAIQRRRKEALATRKPSASVSDPPDADLWRAVGEELDRLPENYRLAVILCDLDGLSRADAAIRLGWNEGTLSTRLHRGRKRLAAALQGRGIAAPALALATLGAATSAPASAVAATIASAASGSVPESIALLIHSTLREMTMRLTTKWPMLLVAGLLTAAFGGLLLAAPEPTPDPTAPKVHVRRNAPVPPKPKWKLDFDKLYSLEEGELVKIIPRAEQPDCRKEFIRDWLVTEYKIKPADIEEALTEAQERNCFAFDVDANGKRRTAYRVDAGFTEVKPQRENCLGVRFDDYLSSAGIIQGFEVTWSPAAFMKFDNRIMQLDNPDLVLRADAPLDKLIPALDKAFDEHLKAKFRIEWKDVEQEVWVVSGKVNIKPRAWRKAKQVDVYVDEANVDKKTFAHSLAGRPYPKPDHDHETGNAKRFLTFLQAQLATHVLWVDDTPPEKPEFDWTHQWGERRSYTDSNSEKVLKNVSEQTGLTFKKEKRKVPMLVISTR